MKRFERTSILRAEFDNFLMCMEGWVILEKDFKTI